MNTITFSEQFDVFTSLIEDEPIHFVKIDGVDFYIDSKNNLIQFNTGYSQDNSKSLVKTVINDEFSATKVFDNVEVFFEPTNDAYINNALFKTSRQVSYAKKQEFDKREESYRLAIPRNSLSETYEERMRDKYLISTYEIDLTGEVNKFFSIPYIKTKFRYSFI